MTITIQQIGFTLFSEGQEEQMAAYERTNPPAGRGWNRNPSAGVFASGIAERVDDYCATAFVYCAVPQAVPKLDVAGAVADIGRKDYERVTGMERRFFGA